MQLSTANLTADTVERVRLKKVMTPSQERWYWVIVAFWVAVNGYYWVWWTQSGHVGDPILFAVVSLAMFYVFTLLPSAYLFFLGHMRHPVHINAQQAQEKGVVQRVAVISLTVPGAESLEIVKRQMLAMKRINYPHDSWILVDKEHSPQIASLARELGINYFSRHDVDTWGVKQVSAWNQPQAPFAAKTKAGNVNSWLDAFGEGYSHFTQLDIDHEPIPEYLDRVLGYFVDPLVAWVQAPSVYGNHELWTARGSSEQEFVLQGPLQMGFFGFSRTPFIIGSHCTYDVKAIEKIGGFQPTRAEDHLDTVCLAAKGYEGVYLPEILATGDGPENFETYLAQQFAWAYSMIQVLFFYTPRLIREYTLRRGVQFLFVQTWYTFWSLSMLVLFAAPLLTLTLDDPLANVSYWAFLAHLLPVSFTAGTTWLWSRKWQFPQNLRLSWRGILLHIARWVAVLSAFVQVVFRVKKPYMITVKGMGSISRFPLAVLVPYITLIGLSLGTCWFYLGVYGGGPSQGYLFFALKGAVLFWLMLVILLVHDVYSVTRSGTPLLRTLQTRSAALVTITSLTVLIALTTASSAELIMQALTA
ncbi:MAG: cellulose synthase [Actinomycetota bacterium]|nr:cellulose synthase [Actinomycetota bacterium]